MEVHANACISLHIMIYANACRSVDLAMLMEVYRDRRYSPNRPITDMHFSQTFPELFLAAYGGPCSKYNNENCPAGCVLVWNLAMKDRPEYALTCQVRKEALSYYISQQ